MEPLMQLGRVVTLGVVLVVAPLVACSRSPSAPAPAASQSSPFTDLAKGYYTLTVDLDDACTTLPASLRSRRYDVLIEDPGWHFLLVRIVGNGFSSSPIIGDLWVRDESRNFRWPTLLRWNELDGESHPEVLGDSRRFYISGNGEMTVTKSTISGDIVGTALLRDGGSEIRCSGSHRFTFVHPSA
jgi:hypothetical protein